MALRSVMVQLSDEQIEQLDRHARRTGVSRSHVVRQAVDAALATHGSDEITEAYRRAYADTAPFDEWGDLDAWHNAAATARHRQ